MICERALLRGYLRRSNIIERETVQASVREVRDTETESHSSGAAGAGTETES